jgi:uncharacterized hydrophobic protein (TIGR00271 family)
MSADGATSGSAVGWRRVLDVLVPEAQRRTAEQMRDDLDLSVGDRRSKTSAFWTMLVLSAVIAGAGILADSTATVIGAMIIAPLATPIMGMALGLATGSGHTVGGSARTVAFGVAAVVAVGVLFSLVLPGGYALVDNGQIVARTSPGLLDLVAAVATGLAGAVALARRDVAAVLPGVAIAISLVPPLAVVGVCLGEGAPWMAAGAFLLFASNLVALVLAGTLVFAVIGYPQARGSRRRPAVLLTVAFVIVAVPLAVNTALAFALAVVEQRVWDATDAWLAPVPGAEVTGVEVSGTELRLDIRTPGDLPDVTDLLTALDGIAPAGLHVVVETSLGDEHDVGTLG